MKNKGIIKTLAIMLTAVVGLSLNFWYENVLAAEDDVLQDYVDIQYDGDSIFPDNGIIRFQQDSAFSPDLKVLSETPDNEYVLEMGAGHLWGNFEASNAKVNIIIDKVVLMPNGASFDLSFDGSRIDLAVYGGDVYVGFLESGDQGISRYHDWFSPVFVNMLLVPRQTQVDIPLSKIGEHLNVLLYSKLVKEFKYSAVPASSYDEEWISGNLKADRKYREAVQQLFASSVFDRGLRVIDGLFERGIFSLQEGLTLIPEQRREFLLNDLFKYLDDAIYYATSGDLENSANMMVEFYAYRGDLPVSVGQSSEFYAEIDRYIDELLIFAPGDDEYEILKSLLDRKFVEGRDIYDVVNFLWLDVYEAIDANDLVAEKALDFYYDHFTSTVGKYDDPDYYTNYISYQNQLFDTLFLRESLFYRDAYFGIKGQLELELISLYQDGQLKDELRQAFVSQKIDFLKRLMKFFFDDDISVNEAMQILSRLVEEVDDLMRDSSADLAVSEFFEDRLADISDFWGYLNTPEYHNSTIYGASHSERYEVYLEEKDVILSFIDLQQDVLGEDVEISLKDVKDEVEAAFVDYDVVTDLNVGGIEDIAQRYVPVEGIIGGYPFAADFDREFAAVTNLYVYEELVSESPVKISNLLTLLQNQFAELADLGDVEVDELDEETNAQIVARVYIASQFSDEGFDVELDDVKVLNQDDALYRVTDISHEDYRDIVLTFDYSAGSEKASNVFLKVYEAPKTVENAYGIQELFELVEFEDALYNDTPEEEVQGDKVLR